MGRAQRTRKRRFKLGALKLETCLVNVRFPGPDQCRLRANSRH